MCIRDRSKGVQTFYKEVMGELDPSFCVYVIPRINAGKEGFVFLSDSYESVAFPVPRNSKVKSEFITL